MCQFFLFCETSINIIKNMEIFFSSETTEITNWFSNIVMLHLLMTHILLLNVILITSKTHTKWKRTLKEALLQNFLWTPFSCHSVFVLTLLLSAKAAQCCSALDAIGRSSMRSCTFLTHPHWMGCLIPVILKNLLTVWEVYTFGSLNAVGRSVESFSPEPRSRHSAKGPYDLACFAKKLHAQT